MKLVSVVMIFIVVFLITAYASLNIVMNLFWGLLNQSPATSGTVYLIEYLVPYICGIGAMIYVLTYLWRWAVRLFTNTDTCVNTAPYIQTTTEHWNDVNKKITNTSSKFCNLKRGVRFMLSMAIIFSLLVIVYHIFASGIMLFNHSFNNSVIIQERLIPDLVCCGSFIFCLIRLWGR